MVGEPCPRPGTGDFHKMLLVSLHCTGGVWPGAAIPFPFGPRHAGQSVAASTAAKAAAVESVVRLPESSAANWARQTARRTAPRFLESVLSLKITESDCLPWIPLSSDYSYVLARQGLMPPLI